MAPGPGLSRTLGSRAKVGRPSEGFAGKQPRPPRLFQAPSSVPRGQFLNFLVSGPKRSPPFALRNGGGRQLLGHGVSAWEAEEISGDRHWREMAEADKKLLNTTELCSLKNGSNCQ